MIGAVAESSAVVRTPCRTFSLLLILSLVVRIGASLAIGLRPDPSFLDIGDEREYYEQASAITRGAYSVDMRRPIGYVSLLALFKLITADNFAALQLMNAAVFSLVAPLLYFLVRRVLGNASVAVLAGLFVIVWPPFVYYGRTLYSET